MTELEAIHLVQRLRSLLGISGFPLIEVYDKMSRVDELNWTEDQQEHERYAVTITRHDEVVMIFEGV